MHIFSLRLLKPIFDVVRIYIHGIMKRSIQLFIVVIINMCRQFRSNDMYLNKKQYINKLNMSTLLLMVKAQNVALSTYGLNFIHKSVL